MRIQLQIKRKELDLIKAGTKKREWRAPSKYNIDKMYIKRESDGVLIANPEINEVEFINGYRNDREKIIVQVLRIRMQQFSKNVDFPEDNFKALEGQKAIEIVLGEIIL
jgi:aminopeptidase-like protein